MFHHPPTLKSVRIIWLFPEVCVCVVAVIICPRPCSKCCQVTRTLKVAIPRIWEWNLEALSSILEWDYNPKCFSKRKPGEELTKKGHSCQGGGLHGRCADGKKGHKPRNDTNSSGTWKKPCEYPSLGFQTEGGLEQILNLVIWKQSLDFWP